MEFKCENPHSSNLDCKGEVDARLDPFYREGIIGDAPEDYPMDHYIHLYCKEHLNERRDDV